MGFPSSLYFILWVFSGFFWVFPFTAQFAFTLVMGFFPNSTSPFFLFYSRAYFFSTVIVSTRDIYFPFVLFSSTPPFFFCVLGKSFFFLFVLTTQNFLENNFLYFFISFVSFPFFSALHIFKPLVIYIYIHNIGIYIYSI